VNRNTPGNKVPVTPHPTEPIRIAAAGDIHCSPATRERAIRAFADLEDDIDLVLLAGDLTTHGTPEQAAVVAEAAADVEPPVIAVLGNHDWQCDRHEEVISILAGAGVRVLQRDFEIVRLRGVDVGIAGVKGFVGGFEGSYFTDFGEPLLRAVYAETGAEVAALDEALAAIASCPVRIVLLHYGPIEETLTGEPGGIYAFMGSDRLAAPIARHRPDLVLHGHAHAGQLRGSLDGIPVYNVAVPVMRRDFWRLELSASMAPAA
jgi:Icc-related predicted phosphoesterase